jgi:hypothetical protein
VSHPLSLPRRTRIVALALVVAAGALAAAGATGLVESVPVALAAVSNLDLPHWVHDLADLLQILTTVIAFLAWQGARRARQ